MDRKKIILTLLEIKGIGKITIRKIFDNFSHENLSYDNFELEDLFDYLVRNYSKLNITFNDLLVKYQKANETIQVCFNTNIKIIDYFDYQFPKKLNELKLPPVLLFYKGNIDRLNYTPTIAIVGTREPSKYGQEIARKYADFFVKKNFNVVSGLAIGIDGISQTQVVNSGGYTYAIIAQGLNTKLYPKENSDLAQRILQQGGALISEYEPNLRPNRNFFVERDRLQSGLSDALLVIETDIIGGTMHSVNSILELKRILGVLDHPLKFSINNTKANGNRMLIEQKNATPLYSLESLENFSNLILGKQIYDENISNKFIEHEINSKVVTKTQNKKKNRINKTNNEVSKDQVDFEEELFKDQQL